MSRKDVFFGWKGTFLAYTPSLRIPVPDRYLKTTWTVSPPPRIFALWHRGSQVQWKVQYFIVTERSTVSANEKQLLFSELLSFQDWSSFEYLRFCEHRVRHVGSCKPFQTKIQVHQNIKWKTILKKRGKITLEQYLERGDSFATNVRLCNECLSVPDKKKTNLQDEARATRARICKPFKGPRNPPAWRNRFLGFLNVYKYGLRNAIDSHYILLHNFWRRTRSKVVLTMKCFVY
jgi:hypothetical protein